ncbi:hypothetical protein R6Q59_011946 [Mikania micrantha]
MSQPYYIEAVESEAETCDSNDSQEDPSFDILEEAQSKLSNLSIKKKSRSRVPVELDEDADCIEIAAPVFDANEERSFEIVQKIIEGCQVEKLKVEQCKLYLRRYGLRLTGKKDVLINRIKEHISIKNGEGEHKYPASSFVMNCKGDACTGDVVMFEQKVYEMYNIASRSATGPPCGQRVVAGRIVKESYGAAKQQHTFTIEVLWSKGTKPLPPLHPLLIKGRNLYRLKTMRQKWEDESERQKILSEKHARGNVARTTRGARLQEKEMKKALRTNRASNGNNTKNEQQENKRKASSPTAPIVNPRTSIQHQGAPLTGVDHKHHEAPGNRENMNPNTARSINDGILRKSLHVEQKTEFYPLMGMDHGAPYNKETLNHQGAPLTGMGHKHHGAPGNRENMNPNTARSINDGILRKSLHVEQKMEFYHPLTGMDHGAPYNKETFSPNTFRGRVDFTLRRSFQIEQNVGLMGINHKHHGASYNMSSNTSSYHYDYNPPRSFQRHDFDPPRLSQSHDYEPPRLFQSRDHYDYDPSRLYQRQDYDPQNRPKSYSLQEVTNSSYLAGGHYQGKRQQLCRYYGRGGCHYGTDCKYMH